MKRNIIFLSIILFAVSTLFAQSITVSSPGSGDNWEKGRRYNITWTKTGRMDANVKIRLFNDTGTTKILDIVNNTLNDGSFPWDIPGSVASGNYLIRVKTIDNRFSDDSVVFNIVSGGIMDILPSPPDDAELSIDEVTREDDKFVRLGEVLKFRVYVKNSGHNPASICVATPNSDKNKNFYTKGTCYDVNGMSTKFYRISIPVTRGLMKDGRFTTTVFLIKGRTTGLLGDVLWKDSNSRDNFKTISYPQSIPAMATVTGVTLSVSPANFTGPCPKIIRFTGRITCTEPGEVRYKWIRSDLQETSHPQNARPLWGTISRNGTLTVTFDWNIGIEGRAGSYRNFWAAIEILPPGYFDRTPLMTSNRAVFSLICTGD